MTLGASELAVVLGLSRTHEDGEPWTSPGTVWARLVGLEERYTDDAGPDAEIGRWGEHAVAARFIAEHGLTWGTEVRVGPSLNDVPLTHPSLPWLHARPDLLVSARPRLEPGPVELKFPRELDPERWGDSGTDAMPPEYLVQLIAQVAICNRLYGCEVGYLAAMARAPRGRDQRVWVKYTWHRDPELERQVLEAGQAWYETHVTGGVAPDADGTESYSRTLTGLWVRSDDLELEADSLVVNDVRRLVQVRTSLKERGRHAAKLRQRIQLRMRQATVLRYQGETIATWRADRNGTRRFRVRTKDGHFEEDEGT